MKTTTLLWVLATATGAFARAISWEAPQTIGADADVATDGSAVYAYHCNAPTNGVAFTVNGVRFTRWSPNSGRAFGRDADVIDGGLQDLVSWNEGLVPVDGTFSPDHVAALRCAVCGSAPGGEMRLRLKNLVPGRRYLAQLWFNSTGCPDMRDRTETIDGAVTLRGSTGETGPGQCVRGTFTATDTFQDIVLAPESDAWAAFNMFQLRALDAVSVRWSPPEDIVGADDVRTDGRLVFAYAHSGERWTVNGTTFDSVDKNVSAYPQAWDRRFASLVMGDGCSWWGAFLADGVEAGSDYLVMLKGAVYRDFEATSLTLRGLVPGHSYLVQLWVNDTRAASPANGWIYRTIRVGGSEPLRYGGMGAAGYGQYVVGTFVADTPELTLPIEPGLARDDVGCKPCSQWNAVQLRDITPDAIAWSAPRAVVGDPKVDVEAAGDLLYAWNSGTEEVAYGGATFKPRMVLNGGKDVAVAPGSLRDLVVNDMRSWADGMIPNVVASNRWVHAEALQALLGPCCYGAVNRSAGVTLRRLVPGRRYRVQVFFADTRPKMGRQDFCLDGVVRLPLCDSTEGAGWSAAGDFIATAPERDILVTTFGTRESVHFQALQVRALDPLGADLRLESGTLVSSTDETDVDTEGALVEACAAEALTVNGVPFAAQDLPAWGNSAHFTFPDGFAFDGAVKRTYLYSPASDYENLLSGGFYRDRAGYSPLTLTVRNLQPGRRYRLQLWQCDARTETATRSSEIGDYGGMAYAGEKGRGWFARIDFVATATTWPLAIRASSLQINALQLRDLGASDRFTAWSGTHALEEDTMFDGNVYVRDGDVTVVGPGTFAMTGEFVGGDGTIATPWAGTCICRTGAGRTILAAAPARPQTLVAAGEGTIQVAAGVTVPATLLGGDGTLAGPGAVEYALAGDAAFCGQLAEGLAVRTSGPGTWLLSGTQAGEASITAAEGAVRLVGGRFAGDWTLSSEAGNPFLLSATAFAPGATLRLEGATALRVEGATDLDGLTLQVADPRRHLRRDGEPILVYAPTEVAGLPHVAFAVRGFASETVDAPGEPGRRAVYATFIGGSTLFLR